MRFSKDKRPYKDHLDLWFWHGEKRGWDRPGFFLRITPERLFLGSGMHQFEGKILDDFRAAVLADKSGEALTKAIAEVKAAGPYEVGGATRKTTPRGFDASHERAGFLLHDGLYADIVLAPAAVASPGFANAAFSHFAAMWPISRWLLEEVARDLAARKPIAARSLFAYIARNSPSTFDGKARVARQFIYHMAGLNKAYGTKKVLENIHLSFYPDAKIGILGPNGAGKSTVLKIMAGLDKEYYRRGVARRRRYRRLPGAGAGARSGKHRLRQRHGGRRARRRPSSIATTN